MNYKSTRYPRIDLQVHTHYSDGGKSPEDMLTRAGLPDEEVEAIAFTDHDTRDSYTIGLRKLTLDTPGLLRRVMDVDFKRNRLSVELGNIRLSHDYSTYNVGWPMFRYDVRHRFGKKEIYVIQATEISVEHEGQRLDLLAYFMPAVDPYFKEKFEAQTDERLETAQRLVERICEHYGWDLNMGDVFRALGPARKVQRPHIAKALMQLKDEQRLSREELPCSTIDEVMRTKLSGEVLNLPSLSPTSLPPLREVVENLLEVKAVPVVPWSRKLTKEGIGPMRELVADVNRWSEGNMGVEVANLRYPEATGVMLEMARDYGISIQTAGSDYHGLEYDSVDRRQFGVELKPSLPTDMLERLINGRKRIL